MVAVAWSVSTALRNDLVGASSGVPAFSFFEDYMGKLFGQDRIDSEGQLRAAQKQTFTADQEAKARAAGFNNAAEAIAFTRQRQANRSPQTQSESFMDRLLGSAFSWHPTNTLNRASRATKDATR